MPETMSPREKVRRTIIDVMKPHDADVTLGRVDLTTDAILAALASSGDHAELAKSLRDSTALMATTASVRMDVWQDHSTRALRAADVLEALIAEVAALRGERDRNWEEYLEERQARMDHGSREAGYLDQIDKLNSRATEAERKLAEAVGLLSRIAFTSEGQSGLSLDECVSAARAFLGYLDETE